MATNARTLEIKAWLGSDRTAIGKEISLSKNWNWWSRKLHRWGAVLTALPMLLVIISGLLLQVKKQSDWVQPPTQRGVSKDVQPEVEWPALLKLAQSVPEAEIQDWSDIDRLDVRPGKGVVKLQSKNRWELQIDLQEGTLLSSTYRRSDFIESLHDGSFFSDAAKLWVFLPNGLVLLGLWLSGIWLWYLPFSRKKSKRAKSA